MKICPQCQNPCADTDTMCPRCGAVLPLSGAPSAGSSGTGPQQPADQEGTERSGRKESQAANGIPVPVCRRTAGGEDGTGPKKAAPKSILDRIRENIPNTENWQEMYFSFEGRVSRSQFFFRWILVNILAAVLIPLLAGMMPVYLVFFATSLIMQVSLATRRFHDIGRNGIWVISMIVPGINVLAVVYLLFARGQKGANEYGPEPL